MFLAQIHLLMLSLECIFWRKITCADTRNPCSTVCTCTACLLHSIALACSDTCKAFCNVSYRCETSIRDDQIISVTPILQFEKLSQHIFHHTRVVLTCFWSKSIDVEPTRNAGSGSSLPNFSSACHITNLIRSEVVMWPIMQKKA